MYLLYYEVKISIMSGTVHIVPIGHTKETIIDSIKKSLSMYPISKVVFVLGDREQASETKARVVAAEVEKSLGLIPCEKIQMDLEDVLGTAHKLVLKIREEKKVFEEIILNLSGSLRTVDIAGFMAASITESKVLIGPPEYDKEGKIKGVKYVIDVPLMPVEKMSEEKLEVLGLVSIKEWKSLDALSIELGKKTKLKPNSLKSKIRFHLGDLKGKKFIETKKDGKTLLIKLSELGKVYYEGLRE